uniref:Uncharacterized protein n=1 Tax=Anguilla anguilla TaxID=7936 RepID=A0A0E9SCN7_ANGAN
MFLATTTAILAFNKLFLIRYRSEGLFTS